MKITATFSFLLLLAVFSVSHSLNAQDQRTVRKLNRMGATYVKYELWEEGLGVYTLLDSLQPGNAQTLFNLGKCMYHAVDKPASLLYFLKAYNSGLQDKELLYYIAKAYQFNYDVPNALSFLHLYKTRIDSLSEKGKSEYNRILGLIEQIKRSQDLLNYKLSVAIENLGGEINSNSPDYVPISLANDSILIFTSRRPGSIGGKIAVDGLHHEDIYTSHLGKDGNWSLPSHIPGFNESHHDASVAISHDERTLYLYKAKHNGDIYYTTRDGKHWSKPKSLTEINSNYWEGSAALSPTGDTIFFSSDRPGGFGGSDIYSAIKDANGLWSNIRNMGPEINSPFDDDAPYIYKDGKTLFFSSKGHNSIGGYDVFTATLDQDGSICDIKNLGFPINTVDDDIYFQLNSTAAYGYFTSTAASRRAPARRPAMPRGLSGSSSRTIRSPSFDT